MYIRFYCPERFKRKLLVFYRFVLRAWYWIAVVKRTLAQQKLHQSQHTVVRMTPLWILMFRTPPASLYWTPHKPWMRSESHTTWRKGRGGTFSNLTVVHISGHMLLNRSTIDNPVYLCVKKNTKIYRSWGMYILRTYIIYLQRPHKIFSFNMHMPSHSLFQLLRVTVQCRSCWLVYILQLLSSVNENIYIDRARIKEACDLMRQLVPGMSEKTDKATVFEFAARYIYFLKNFVGTSHDKVKWPGPSSTKRSYR